MPYLSIISPEKKNEKIQKKKYIPENGKNYPENRKKSKGLISTDPQAVWKNREIYVNMGEKNKKELQYEIWHILCYI